MRRRAATNASETLRLNMADPAINTGARAVVFNAQQQVLLHLRRDFRVWGVPGGRVEADETPAAVREVREETGYDITIEHLIGEYGRPGTGLGHELVYRAQVCGEQPLQSGPETRAVRWFPLTALPWRMTTTHPHIFGTRLPGQPCPSCARSRCQASKQR